MSFENKRLYQVIGEQLKEKILAGHYPVGTKMPPERVIAEELGISRTVVREAMIMLELEGLVEVRKGSGIHVISKAPEQTSGLNESEEAFARYLVEEMKKAGPFELLQARQVVECTIASFAASQVTKQDIDILNKIQKQSYLNAHDTDSVWDEEFHIQLGKITKNSVLSLIIELIWFTRKQNPLWMKLHEHIDPSNINRWADEHGEIVKALQIKNSQKVKAEMWQHLESTKKFLYDASSSEDTPYDKYLFETKPVDI
ncbi:GntR family transcriptional regulator [Vibrio gangliei]|uniref:GntR family transcriptional regulator n=1 Tax=Vibrio gangliei TaxID=2077090 RepID=UPI000D017683|nr:GntR family transcriptional regulator [Vibrio gangliei]